ncbi:hypothetical protein LI82_02620 [Methanococcoides methylutens]|uniref:Tyr recombinase domain-containing protein n=1 Tax=Methanococcoides methylutens TaxID=2226 RepID=A0A099T1A6_METMT|nr:site-specific integrase [Methanococcoides methylutens]KGK98955.1 hypothetical protein LI82_02620 [Methanococcoides methylutens]
MKKSELEKDEYINEWFMGRNLAPRTRINYILGMQHYTEYTGKTPIQLIDEAESDIQNGVLPRKRSIKGYLIGFKEHLKGNVVDNSVRAYVAAVKSFYTFFDIPIPDIVRNSKRAKPSPENLKIPTIDDVREALKHCDIREKAIILVGLSSGLSANEITNLKICDFKDGYDEDTKITTLKLRRGKTGVDFVTFLTPEASEAVGDYLEWRNREIKFHDASRKNAALKQRINDDNGYLFICKVISGKFLETGDEELRRFDAEKGLGKMYSSINIRLGKGSTNRNRHLIRSHNMRKLFSTTLKSIGCNNTMVEYWMGHSLSRVDDAYFKPNDIDKMKGTYRKYMPHLLVQKENVIAESPEFQKIVEENEKLSGEVAKAVLERSEMENMKARLAEQDTKIEEQAKDNEIFTTLLNKLRENPEFLNKIMQT